MAATMSLGGTAGVIVNLAVYMPTGTVTVYSFLINVLLADGSAGGSCGSYAGQAMLAIILVLLCLFVAISPFVVTQTKGGEDKVRLIFKDWRTRVYTEGEFAAKFRSSDDATSPSGGGKEARSLSSSRKNYTIVRSKRIKPEIRRASTTVSLTDDIMESVVSVYPDDLVVSEVASTLTHSIFSLMAFATWALTSYPAIPCFFDLPGSVVRTLPAIVFIVCSAVFSLLPPPANHLGFPAKMFDAYSVTRSTINEDVTP